MSEKLRRFLSGAALLLMGIAIGGVGVYTVLTGTFLPAAEHAEEIAASADKYVEILELADEYFIGEELDFTEINDAMAEAVVDALGDRWSYYVTAEDYQAYLDNINNSYVGVGITITAHYDEAGNMLGYLIKDVSAGGPAQEAGILAGDVLTHASGTDVTTITLEETKSIVKGEEGTTVDLTILRDGQELVLTVERRAVIVIPATGQMIGEDVGYIIIDNFDSGCADTVIGLIDELKAQGATSLLFDVRNNPGGLKRELTDLLDYLLPEGTVFHQIDYSGHEEKILSDEDFLDMPMAVLVNESSYSAAEYFACAIREYDAGFIVGEKTFGKGYYQVGMQLSDGSCVNLSIGKYFTPNGESLIDVGVTPDIELALDSEQASYLSVGMLPVEEDPQIQAALERLDP